MGLDFGFYKPDGTETLEFRNHHDLFRTLCARPLVRIEPYADFYVTRLVIVPVLKDIEADMRAACLTINTLPEPGTHAFSAHLRTIPAGFFFDEPDELRLALPIYRVLLTNLLLEVDRHGTLICGWSA